jgi:hypothetical protein
MAYENLDADAYLDCLAEDFRFFLNPEDITNDPTLPEYWGKATEETIAHNMLGDGSSVEKIALALNQVGDPIGNPAVVDGWDYNHQAELRIYVYPVTYVANNGAVFTLCPSGGPGPGGHELWEILYWYDVDGFWAGREEASWGTIKALFR